jgi:hypothetical protein
MGTRWQGGPCKCCRRTWLTLHQHPHPTVTNQIYYSTQKNVPLTPYVWKQRWSVLQHESVCRDTSLHSSLYILNGDESTQIHFTLQPALPRQQMSCTHIIRYRPRKCTPWLRMGGLGGGIAPSILHLGMKRGLVISLTPRQLYPRGKNPSYSSNRRLKWAP